MPWSKDYFSFWYIYTKRCKRFLAICSVCLNFLLKRSHKAEALTLAPLGYSAERAPLGGQILPPYIHGPGCISCLHTKYPAWTCTPLGPDTRSGKMCKSRRLARFGPGSNLTKCLTCVYMRHSVTSVPTYNCNIKCHMRSWTSSYDGIQMRKIHCALTACSNQLKLIQCCEVQQRASRCHLVFTAAFQVSVCLGSQSCNQRVFEKYQLQCTWEEVQDALKGQYHHFDEIWHCIGPTFLVRELKTDPRSSTPLSRYRRSKYERCTTLWIVLHYLHCLSVCTGLNWPPVIKLLPWSFHQIL